MVKIDINGQTLEAEQGAMIIEVADKAGIRIPRFCYHKKLSIAANCRMCLVEVGNSRKPLPACATPVTDGMKVFTRSKLALEAQKAVMEFLLINHPLDCPICDQGGECELQDVSMGYGGDTSFFHEGKRAIKDKNLGPLISTEMTRCIQCTRCVRFGTEIAGMRELGAVDRGEYMEITTYIEHSVDSELSGNIIDLCPVGALTSKPFRFSARPWEMRQLPSIAPHDCVGSHIAVHTLRDQVKRVVPREALAINDMWLSDRDRFGYLGLYGDERVQQPRIKENGVWRTVDWTTALAFAAEHLQHVIDEHGATTLGGLISSSATVEEHYLFQKLLRGLGTSHIDHRLKQSDFSDQTAAPLYPSLGMSIQELSHVDVALLVGSNLRKEQPILNYRLRMAAENSGKVLLINTIDYPFNFHITAKQIMPQGDLVSGLAQVVKAFYQLGKHTVPKEFQNWFKTLSVSPEATQQAEYLLQAKRNVILLGPTALHHPHAALLQALAQLITQYTQGTIGLLSEGANSAGAWLAGTVPHRTTGGVTCDNATAFGMNASQMLEGHCRGFVLLGVEPEYDCADSGKALSALSQAECVVALTAYQTPHMQEYADVILPITPFTEMAGTFVNCEGHWQPFQAVVPALGESRPAWKVLRVLANLLEVSGFQYQAFDQVSQECVKALEDTPTFKAQPRDLNTVAFKMPVQDQLTRIADTPLYAVDPIVRRSQALQATHDAITAQGARMNAKTAATHHLTSNAQVRITQEGREAVTLSVMIDDSIPVHSIYIAQSSPQAIGLGDVYAPITLEKVGNA